MSNNLPVPGKQFLPDVSRKTNTPNPFAIITYEKTDAAHYSFTCSLDETFEFRMDESDQTIDNTEFVDAEFADNVPESNKIYYAAAAASGFLTGALSMVQLNEEQLKAIDEFKEKDWKPIVINAAKLTGFKKSDYKGASKYLINKAVRTIEKKGKNPEYLAVLAEHPSLTGFIFSVITQYSCQSIVLNGNGDIIKQKLPDYYVIGDTNAEKLVCAFFYWLFALAADEAISGRHVLEELKISRELLKKIKEFTGFLFIKKSPVSYETAEKAFSKWLDKTIKGAELYSESQDNGPGHPLFALMGYALNVADDSFPVLINKCIVHSLYILIRICSVVKEQKITSFEELIAVSPEELLPSDEKLLSRMYLIASASFSVANIAGATLAAIKGKKTNGKNFSETFFVELNMAGIGSFLFACASDSKYWGEDIRILLQRNKKTSSTFKSDDCPHTEDSTAFESLLLNAAQARVLYCLENILVQYDIQHTEKPKIAEKKQLWLDIWKETILNGIDSTPELASDYFVENEDLLYDGIYQLTKDKSHWRWFYLMTQELVLFKPYFALGCREDKEFKKLKLESDYVANQFVRRQTIVNQSEVDSIAKNFNRYNNYVSGSTQAKLIGVGAMAAAAIATGGLAMTFAPEIAVAIAGEAVAGLHGAALTSASLAFVGGGSLAAGGLGVAGGTAVITGGGALIGLAGSGSISAAAVLLQTPGEYWGQQSAKLLTYCKCILTDTLHDKASVKKILQQTEIAFTNTKQELDEIKAEKNDLDKEIISKTEDYLKYLGRCLHELQKLSVME